MQPLNTLWPDRIGGRTAAFSPASLFANGEVGGWYDPSDMSLYYQDSNGLTPVTAVGQKVGLELDPSKGLALGSVFTASSWTNTANAWDVFTPTGGSFTAEKTIAGGIDSAISDALVAVVTGRFYQITITVSAVAGLSYGVNLAAGTNSRSTSASFNTTGTKVLLVQATATGTFSIAVNTGQLGSITVTSASVREFAGIHRAQTTDAQRPIYGVHPYFGTRNLLVQSNTFSTTWIATNSTRTSGATTSPNGTNNAWLWTRSSTAASYMQQVVTKAATAFTYTGSIYVKKSVGDYFAFRLQGTYPARVDAVFNLATGTISSAAIATSTFTGASAAIQDAGNGWYRVSLTATSDTATNIAHVISFNSNNVQIDGDDSAANSAGFIYGAQFELGSSVTAYQTVTTQFEVTESGVPPVYYLFFDGVDDNLATGTIVPNTDKVQVFMGIRKLTDNSFPILAELSINGGTNAGALTLQGRTAGSVGYNMGTRGTAGANAVVTSVPAAPLTSVLTGLGDISAPFVSLAHNGGSPITSTATQGTGNFLSYPMYFGRRSQGAVQPFHGHVYRTLFRFGPNLSGGIVANTEKWINTNTGAY